MPYRVCLPAHVEVDKRSAKTKQRKTQRQGSRPLIYKDGGEDCIRVQWGAPEGQGQVDGVGGPELGMGRVFDLERGKQRKLNPERVCLVFFLSQQKSRI